MVKSRTLPLTLCALFAALSAILSQIAIPIGPVPVTMTHTSVFMAAGLLGAKYGSLSQLVFVLMGAAGLPVFSGFRGGFGIITGPTGGFIIGYIGCALVTGLLIGRFGMSLKALIPAMYAGWLVTYVCGVTWFMYSTNTGFLPALTVCVYPFLPGDVLKTAISAVLIGRLHPIIYEKLSLKV